MTASTRLISMSRPVWTALDTIRQAVKGSRRLFLFLDFDGTLSPIVEVPSMAVMPPEIGSVLGALAADRRVVVVVTSGREVDDLQRRIRLPIVYAGNHGLEVRGAGLLHTVSGAQELRFQLLAMCNRLRARLESFAGALVEYKQLTASVHVRQVDSDELPAVVHILQSTLQLYPRFQVCAGNEVFDIRPCLSSNKGSAARWILEQFNGRASETISMGDDTTDEDMFSELEDGITVRVGSDGATCARYTIEQTGVPRFLAFLRDAVMEGRS